MSHGNHWSKISVHGDVCLNMETDVNHSEFGQENMVDGTFLQMHSQVQWLVHSVTADHMHCRAEVGVSGSTFFGASL